MPATRIKDAGFVQQHLEKLILAAGVLILAIAVFLFVIGNPFAVEVNGQKYDKPGEAINVLVNGDKRLENGLQNPEPIPPMVPPKFQENFIAHLQIPADPRLVQGLSDPGLTEAAENPIKPQPSRYALVYPPVPKNIDFVNGVDVLDKEFDPAVTKQFFELWGKDMEEPGDFTMFIAAGEFDVWDWVTRLRAEDLQGVDGIKIPAGIWAQRFGIAGTALLREEWDPEQGMWDKRQIVSPLPGQVRVLQDDKAEAEITLALAEIAQMRQTQAEMAQPELPWLEDFAQVTPPGNEEDGQGAGGLIQALNDENLGPAEIEIRKLEEKIQQLEERQAKRNNRGGNNDRPRDIEPGNSRPDPIARQIESLREKIERLRPKAEIDARNRQRLAEQLRIREEERKRREALRNERDRRLAGPDDQGDGLARIEGMDLREGSTLRVWAADPSMQPGKTYRYKLLVSVINPLYAVPRLAPDQLEENAQRAALFPTEREIDAMPWIGPIKVEPESSFFFTAGRDAGARVEIYRRYKGELQVQVFDGTPGDSIGTLMEKEDDLGQPEEIDMAVGAVLVDVEKRRDVFSGRTVYTMIYTDEEGNIHERIDDIDKSSPTLRELRDEKENGPEQALRGDPELRDENNFEPGFNDF